MKNKFIKLICLLLCLALALSAFAGCKGKTPAKKIKRIKKPPQFRPSFHLIIRPILPQTSGSMTNLTTNLRRTNQ